MRALTIIGMTLVLAATWIASAHADTTDATCEVHKEGETKKGASGPCTFSQRQGYVDIDLRNGEKYSLSPANKANHFKDQKGEQVERTQATRDSQTYRWEHKRIVVTFGGREAEPASGSTPSDLRDLVNGRRVGAEVDDAMTRRGYTHVKDDTSGDEVWSNWRKTSSGDCVVVHFDKQRKVKSIVTAPKIDCK